MCLGICYAPLWAPWKSCRERWTSLATCTSYPTRGTPWPRSDSGLWLSVSMVGCIFLYVILGCQFFCKLFVSCSFACCSVIDFQLTYGAFVIVCCVSAVLCSRASFAFPSIFRRSVCSGSFRYHCTVTVTVVQSLSQLSLSLLYSRCYDSRCQILSQAIVVL